MMLRLRLRLFVILIAIIIVVVIHIVIDRVDIDIDMIRCFVDDTVLDNVVSHHRRFVIAVVDAIVVDDVDVVVRIRRVADDLNGWVQFVVDDCIFDIILANVVIVVGTAARFVADSYWHL